MLIFCCCYFSSLITFYQMHWWYSNFNRIKQRCVQFVDINWWHNSLSFFCYYNFFSEKWFRFWPKKSFRVLVGTIGLHLNPGIYFMSLAVKGMIRMANEESNCLSSFVILTMLIKEVPELEWKPIVPTKARKDFFWAKIWNLFLERNCI